MGCTGPDPYIGRDHGTLLRKMLSAAVAGPVMVVLVGGSSTGKIRAAFEAARQCLPEWALLRPVGAATLLDTLSGGVDARTLCGVLETFTNADLAALGRVAADPRLAQAAAAVRAYIGAAYWFTSSTSFANPAITPGRMFSDTFAGIAPFDALVSRWRLSRRYG